MVGLECMSLKICSITESGGILASLLLDIQAEVGNRARDIFIESGKRKHLITNKQYTFRQKEEMWPMCRL